MSAHDAMLSGTEVSRGQLSSILFSLILPDIVPSNSRTQWDCPVDYSRGRERDQWRYPEILDL